MLRGSAKEIKRGIFSNFCGPGGYGLPQHATDRICAEHDADYDIMLKQGKNPYLNYNWADKKMVDALNKIAPQSVKEQLLKQVSIAVWKVKEVVLGNDGSVEYITPDNPGKRKRDQSSITPARKKLNMGKQSDDDVVMGNPPLVAPPGAPAGLRQGIQNTGVMGAAHGETGIDPYKYPKRTPWKPTETVVMHYFATPGAQTITTAAPAWWSYRLNSIYDCRDSATWSDVEPSIVADSADATVNTPTWRNYWTTFYNYWTVTECKYRIRFRIDPASATSKETQLMCYVYHHGIQKPPLYAEPTGSGTTVIDHQFRRQHRGMYYFPITYKPDTGFSNIDQYDNNVCSGTWTPGSIEHEVAEDELQHIWNKVSEVPPTREGLTIIVQKSPVNGDTGSITILSEVSLEYTVQLKDLKRAYQYPTQSTAVPAIANASAQGN